MCVCVCVKRGRREKEKQEEMERRRGEAESCLHFFRIQYIQEVILPTPSLFEENMMSVLNSFILFNKTEIIKMIQEDSRFLKQLFTELCDDSTPDSKYQELVSLIKEVCMFSLALESNDRSSFFLKLSGFGFMSAIEGMLVSS